MSVQAITWALSVRVRSATHKAVLLALANRLDPNGFGWPSQKLVAKESQCSDRTVRRVLRDLEADGILVRDDRRREDGSYTTDTVQFAMPMDPADNLAAGQPEDTLSAGYQGKNPNKNNDGPADNLAAGKVHQRTDCPDSLRLNQTISKRGLVDRNVANLPGALGSYNEAAARCGWVAVREFTERRRSAARAAWKRLGGADGWRNLIATAERQSFLGGANDRGWRMDFDFIVKPANIARILEGKYLTATERQAEPDAKEMQRRLWLLREHGPSVWQRSWGPRPDLFEAKEG